MLACREEAEANMSAVGTTWEWQVTRDMLLFLPATNSPPSPTETSSPRQNFCPLCVAHEFSCDVDDDDVLLLLFATDYRSRSRALGAQRK